MEQMTDRHALPLMQAGQAQKELTHNEALVRLDMLAMAAVEGIADVAPVVPVPGECWIVGGNAVGEWAAHAGSIAGWTAAGWRFLSPREGMSCWMADAGLTAIRRDGAWRTGEVNAATLRIGGVPVVGPRQGVIAGPAGGSTIDVEARDAIGSILSALREHGLIATT